MQPAPVFKVDGKDFTHLIKLGGLGWSRNDIDASGSGRAMDIAMRRARLGQKRKLNFSCLEMDYDELHALSLALNPQFIKVTYLDPQFGVVTRTFYGTKVEATTEVYDSGKTIFKDTQFNLVER